MLASVCALFSENETVTAKSKSSKSWDCVALPVLPDKDLGTREAKCFPLSRRTWGMIKSQSGWLEVDAIYKPGSETHRHHTLKGTGHIQPFPRFFFSSPIQYIPTAFSPLSTLPSPSPTSLRFPSAKSRPPRYIN